jgi:hypothetical protein
MLMNIWKNRQQNGTGTLNVLEALLCGRSIGTPLRSGALGMVPLFGSPVAADIFAPPESSLGLTQVTHYGRMILKNNGSQPAIVPLHVGYFQKAAQNHAMCRSWVLAPGEAREFNDACCIQQAQGGYIAEADDRFIILPQPLRAKALSLRGEENYSKLWSDIAQFNKALGLKKRGHLDELKQAHQPMLLRTAYKLERHPQQTGAIFLHNHKIVGIELAPDARFWEELHTPLVMYCYAPLALTPSEAGVETECMDVTLEGLESVEHLEQRMKATQKARADWARRLWTQLSKMSMNFSEEGRSHKNLVFHVESGQWVGQGVLHGELPAYLSMTDKTGVVT